MIALTGVSALGIGDGGLLAEVRSTGSLSATSSISRSSRLPV